MAKKPHMHAIGGAMVRDSLIFYRSFYEAAATLNESDRLKLYDAIMRYAFTGRQDDLNGVALACWLLIKPQIDANNQRYMNGKKGAEFGALGGRPKKNTDGVTEKTPMGFAEITPNEKEKEKGKVKEKEDITTAVCGIPLNTGNDWFPTVKEYDEMVTLYKNVNVPAEFNKMRGWCLANPTRRKTARGVRRFVAGWLAKEQDRTPTKQPTRPNYYEKTIDTTQATQAEIDGINALFAQMKGEA